MAESSDDQPFYFVQPRQRQRQKTPEEVWIRGFLEFYGTDNVTRFFRADLRGVSLTRAVEAVVLGEMVGTEKCEGAGAISTFEYEADDGEVVRVNVFFVADEMKLEFREAYIVEVEGEPNAA